ncbi:hypothetical protein ACFRQM_03835 [Streptomyces sp. NPDC056831]|uniref:hypothetical protein n=1 Tax=Streptomyces sp. NPDC056831 TaxID=3345954 RepID=UPI0036B977C2
MDLTARHPRTGELLSTVKFMVQTLAAAGELQRDLQRELTYDGLRAAEAKGSKGGRRPAVTAAKAAAVRAGYLGGQSIAGCRSSPNRPGRRSSRTRTGAGSPRCSGPTSTRTAPSAWRWTSGSTSRRFSWRPVPAPLRTPPAMPRRSRGEPRADGPVLVPALGANGTASIGEIDLEW